MKRVKYSGKSPEYIDGFPDGCKRSCKGAIHLLPGAVRELTEDEIEFIKGLPQKVALAVLPAEKSRRAMKPKPAPKQPKVAAPVLKAEKKDDAPKRKPEHESGFLKKKHKK